MFWKLARKIDAEEMVRVNLRLCPDLVNATRLVVSCRPGSREHHRRTQLKGSGGPPVAGQFRPILHLGLRAGHALPLTIRHLHPGRPSLSTPFPVQAPVAIPVLPSTI